MKLFSPSRRTAGFIEPLEARVAPAIIDIGFPVNGGPAPDYDTLYTTTKDSDTRPHGFNTLYFVPTFTINSSGNSVPASDLISQAVDDPGFSGTYYLKLTAGDVVQVYSTVGSTYSGNDLISVKSGTVVAFFTDSNHDGHYEEGEFTGLALSANASVQIDGRVYGDVVTDLAPDGTIHTGDLVGPKQGIKSLVVGGGSIFGDVLSGGNISTLHVAQGVNNVLAGTAAIGAQFDFFQIPDPANPGQILKRFTVAATEPAGQAGASIANVSVGFLGQTVTTIGDSGPVTTFIPGVLQAGDGGAGAKGGSLTNIAIQNDDQVFSLLAGAGGAAAAGRSTGGAGGSITNVFVSGVPDLLSDPLLPNPHANELITIHAGDGGNGSVTGVGGSGGSLNSVFVGYDSAATASISLSADDVLLEGGDGGSGATGGSGGGITLAKVRVVTPLLDGHEITVEGGHGGASTATNGGASGKGGSLANLDIRNQVDTTGSTITLQAGDAGSAPETARGGAGGSISTASVLGFNVDAYGGNGANGKTGGVGGSVAGINVLQGLGVDILNQNAIFDGGIGGSGAAGNGGNGGAVSNVAVPISDYAAFLVNESLHGNGGASTGGRGGNGGAVNNVSVTDIDSHPGDPVLSLAGVATIRAGDGGDGSKGGGTGGALNLLSVDSAGLTVTANAGAGGDATLSGAGGAGGALSKVNLTLADNFELTNQNGISVPGVLFSGHGGAGLGAGVGGAGGIVSSVDLDAAGNASVTAGSGGAGQVANGNFKGTAAGKGGSVLSSGVFAESGSGIIQAGDAGSAGAGAAAGGSIIGGTTTAALVGLRALTDLSIIAGKGFGGGAGGSITNVTYGVSTGDSDSVAATPLGNILIQAGDGSVGKRAGAGGSITHLSGSVSSGVSKVTSITAGSGDGNATVGSAGGSITDVTISGGGAAQGLFTIAAGDAGNSTGAKVGAKGGNVTQVQVINLDLVTDPDTGLQSLAPFDQQTDFQSIAAGNGGNASSVNGKGGAGGTISQIHVQNHDIGLRTGAVFGYNSAGGLFAGVGGTGKTNGVNGSVTQVNADAIASIVAGRTLTPQMALSVDHILLNGNSLLTQQSFNAPGSYTLTFGSDTTVPLPAGATSQQVQNALNALPGITTAGGVTVSYGQLPGTYIVLFTATGAQVAISGTEQVAGASTELIAGATATVPVIETTPGGQVLPQTIAQLGQFAIIPAETVHGTTFISATTVVEGDADTGVNAVESINISDIAASTTARFNLSFDGVTTANLPGTSTALQIANALNGLTTIAGVGGVTVQPSTVNGSVVPGLFTITFVTPADVDTITGTKLQREIQTVNVSSLSSLPNGTYTLTFGASTTNPALPAAATAANLQTALNKLPTIALSGGVTVTNVVNAAGVQLPGDFNITFQTIGEQPLFGVVGDTKQVQTLDLSPIQSDGGGANVTFSVTATGGAVQTTTPVAVTASASDIQTALDKLPSVALAGGVTVVSTSAHTFSIIFGNTGAAPTIVPTANVDEVQTINISSVDHVATGGFTLTFNGATTSLLPANATATQIANALNALATVAATGLGGAGGTVTVAPAGADQFAITFSNVGQQNLIMGAGSIAEQQQVEVYAPTSTQGAPFTLSFGGATTGILAGGSSATDVQTALNKLTSIVAFGGVTVTAQNSVYTVTFNMPGLAPGILITGTETETLAVTTIQPGTSTASAEEQIAPSTSGALNPAAFAAANLVGSIYDINARDANVFHYLHNGVLSTGNFKPGDTPIDGIVMAQNLDQSTINFTPEAKYTDAGFFDNDNIF